MNDERAAQCLRRVSALETGLRQQVESMQQMLDEALKLRALIEINETTNAAHSSTSQVATTMAVEPRYAKEPPEPSQSNIPEVVECSKLEDPTDGVVVDCGRVSHDSIHQLEAQLEEIAADVSKEVGITPEEVMKAYKCFCDGDRDHSGKLDCHELHGLLEKLCGTSLPKRETEKMLAEFDTDTDGSVSFEEFLFCYCHTPGKKEKHLAEFVNCKSGALPPSFRAYISGVRTSHIKDYIAEEIKEMNACLTLPIMLVLFLSFLISVLYHRNVVVMFGVENAFSHDIIENANFAFSGIVPFENGRMGHKNIFDVNTYADFWSWFGIGLVPMLFPESWDVSEQAANIGARCTAPANAMSSFGWKLNDTLSGVHPTGDALAGAFSSLCSQLESPTPPKDFFKKPPYLFFNSIVAGLRLSQEQLPHTPCVQTSLSKAAYDTACVDDPRTWLNNPGHWISPVQDEAAGMDKTIVNQPGGETQYLLSQKSQSNIREELKALEQNVWLNQRTAKIEILYTTYNAHKNVFTALYIYFMFNRGGQIHKFIKPVSFSLDPYEYKVTYVTDVIFVILVLKIMVEEGRELLKLCVWKGVRGGCVAYFSTPNEVVDWASIIFSFVIFGLWGNYLYMLSTLRAELGTGDSNVVGTFADDGQRASFFNLVDSVTETAHHFQVVLAFYPFVLGWRFFSAFGGQPRLALVTNTLKSAAVDVVHFGVVMLTLMALFSVSAQILYGHDLDEFATFDRAFMSVFRGMLGDIDYDELIKVGRKEVRFWFILFNVLLQLLMLNMLLAIIFDIYSAVKTAVPDNAETFWSQTYEIFTRWNRKRKGEEISLEAILVSLEACDAEYLNVMTFQKAVKNLGARQAEALLEEADEHALQAAPVDKETEARERARRIDMRIQHVQLMATRILSNSETVIRDISTDV